MPTWSYSEDPQASDLDAVRFLIGDTVRGDPQVSNEEIEYLLVVGGSPTAAAIRLAKALEARYSKMAQSRTVGDLSINYGDRAARYREIAASLTSGSGAAVPVPSFGGGSVSEKIAAYEETDRDAVRITPGFTDMPGGPYGWDPAPR